MCAGRPYGQSVRLPVPRRSEAELRPSLERVGRGLGGLHRDAGLILGVRRGLEDVVDCLHRRNVGEVGLLDTANLQALHDRRRITQRLIDDQV